MRVPRRSPSMQQCRQGPVSCFTDRSRKSWPRQPDDILGTHARNAIVPLRLFGDHDLHPKRSSTGGASLVGTIATGTGAQNLRRTQLQSLIEDGNTSTSLSCHAAGRHGEHDGLARRDHNARVRGRLGPRLAGEDHSEAVMDLHCQRAAIVRVGRDKDMARSSGRCRQRGWRRRRGCA
jgi:hypothetical protein